MNRSIKKVAILPSLCYICSLSILINKTWWNTLTSSSWLQPSLWFKRMGQTSRSRCQEERQEAPDRKAVYKRNEKNKIWHSCSMVYTHSTLLTLRLDNHNGDVRNQTHCKVIWRYRNWLNKRRITNIGRNSGFLDLHIDSKDTPQGPLNHCPSGWSHLHWAIHCHWRVAF
jgi:hypothetical protein